VEAAERANRAGFDAVEIQFGGGYLLAAFYHVLRISAKTTMAGSEE